MAEDTEGSRHAGSRPTRWWSRDSPEPHQPVPLCGREGCSSPPISAFDLYCARNGHLLLASGTPSRQTVLLNAARAMAGALVLLAANVESDVPLLVLAALLGLQLLLAPLRLFEISRVMAGVGWCVLVLLAALVHLGVVPSEALRGAVNAGWVVFVIAAAATFATEEGVGPAAERMVGAAIIGGAGLLSLLAARAVAPGLLGGLPEVTASVALVIGVMLIAGGVAAAATTGLARGVRISDTSPSLEGATANSSHTLDRKAAAAAPSGVRSKRRPCADRLRCPIHARGSRSFRSRDAQRGVGSAMGCWSRSLGWADTYGKLSPPRRGPYDPDVGGRDRGDREAAR